VITNDLDGLLNSAATGHDIFGDDELLARLDLKSSAEDEAAIAIFLHEDVFFTEVASHFLSDDDTSNGWRNDGGSRKWAELIG
jgi:hypothetical protein